MGKWLLPHPEKSNHTTEISFPPEDLRIQCRKSLFPWWICEIHCRALVPLGSPNVKIDKRGEAFPYPLIFKEDPSYYRMRQGLSESADPRDQPYHRSASKFRRRDVHGLVTVRD